MHGEGTGIKKRDNARRLQCCQAGLPAPALARVHWGNAQPPVAVWVVAGAGAIEGDTALQEVAATAADSGFSTWKVSVLCPLPMLEWKLEVLHSQIPILQSMLIKRWGTGSEGACKPTHKSTVALLSLCGLRGTKISIHELRSHHGAVRGVLP